MHLHHPCSKDNTNRQPIVHCIFQDCLGNSPCLVCKDPLKQRFEDLVDKFNFSLITDSINTYDMQTPTGGQQPEEKEESAIEVDEMPDIIAKR